MFLSAVSVLIVALPSSEIPEGLMNYLVLLLLLNINVNSLYKIPCGDKYGSLKGEDLHVAVHALRNGDISLHVVTPTYSLPKATLKRHFDGKNVQYIH
jgi:hypothetical protein